MLLVESLQIVTVVSFAPIGHALFTEADQCLGEGLEADLFV